MRETAIGGVSSSSRSLCAVTIIARACAGFVKGREDAYNISYGGHRVLRFASPHLRCRVTNTARSRSYLRADRAPCRDAWASTPRGLCTTRGAQRQAYSVAESCECAGRIQPAWGSRITTAAPSRARRYSLRPTRPNTTRFFSVATKKVNDPQVA